METKIVVTISVNDEGSLEKEITIRPALSGTSEEIAENFSDMIDRLFVAIAKQVGNIKVVNE